MKKRLYLVRHGQTMFNRQQRIQGWCDSPLTDVGKKQAEFVKEWLDGHEERIDAAYCSTSERCSDTLEIITAMPYTRSKALKEMSFGELEGETECLAPSTREAYETFFLPFGGESSLDVGARMRSELARIMSEPQNEHVLVVSHGGSSISFLLRIGAGDKLPMGVTNGCIFVIDYDDEMGTFELVEYVPNPVR